MPNMVHAPQSPRPEPGHSPKFSATLSTGSDLEVTHNVRPEHILAAGNRLCFSLYAAGSHSLSDMPPFISKAAC